MMTDMVHAGWGDPSHRTGLPPAAGGWLARTVGAPQPSRPVPLAEAVVPASRLSDVAPLVAVVGAEHVLTDDAARALRAAGRSYLDLLALRSGAFAAPDAVVLPGTAAEVASVLSVCAGLGIAVVPFGGGTSVVGGVAPLAGPHRAVVSLDLRRLDRLVSFDEQSMTAELQAGLRGPAAEALLNAHDATLGHFPQSWEHATIGGFAATRSSGQASTGYGRFDANVLGVMVQTPRGELRLGRGAATAAGPGLLQLFVGSEGTLGVITSVTVRVRKLPEVRRYEGFSMPSWEAGLALLRRLEQSGLAPDVARLSDPSETRVSVRMAGSKVGRVALHGRCLLILGWEGTSASVSARRRAARVRAVPLGQGAGRSWERGRYHGPYLRDDLLDAGFLVETLETSATWSTLESTWTAVRTALLAELPDAIVMCHVSHLYPQGASLYFTVLAAPDQDPVAQWQRAKAAASDVIVASGATITHHHAVGTDHRPWMTDEIGTLGVEVLRAVKAVLDPAGVLNPGKLLPED